MKLGILGGTFDPVHLGHLRTAEEIGERLGLEKVYLIPSASPPHKTNEPVTPFYHRLAMTELSVIESPLLEVLDLEGRRAGPSFSIVTLKEIHDIYSPEELYFIIGTDAFLEIKTWKDYKSLFSHTNFVVILRAGIQPFGLMPLLSDLGIEIKKTDTPDVFHTSSDNILIFLESTPINISSTRIRKMVSKRESIRFLTPERVRDYIIKKGLYKIDANA